jgi:hypothetical protein
MLGRMSVLTGAEGVQVAVVGQVSTAPAGGVARRRG